MLLEGSEWVSRSRQLKVLVAHQVSSIDIFSLPFPFLLSIWSKTATLWLEELAPILLQGDPELQRFLTILSLQAAPASSGLFSPSLQSLYSSTAFEDVEEWNLFCFRVLLGVVRALNQVRRPIAWVFILLNCAVLRRIDSKTFWTLGSQS